MTAKETVSDEAHEDQWGVRSIDKVQRTLDRVGGRARVITDEERVLQQGWTELYVTDTC